LTTDLGIPYDELALCTVTAARGTGTGFAFLKPTWIVTAKHVVSGQPPEQPIALLFREGPALTARVLFEHPQVDVAVLEVVGNTRCRAPFMPGHGAPIEGGLLCVGYKPSVSDRDVGRYTSFVSGVDSYERTTRQRDGHEEILFIFPAPHGEPGHSGGPLLAPGGAVIGVVVDGITLAGQHVMRATSIAAVLDHLAFCHMR
jgi:S1-C subfamily serine protease